MKNKNLATDISLLINEACALKLIEPIDVQLSLYLLADHGPCSTAKLLLCHLSLALRKGFAALQRRADKTIVPTVEQLWLSGDEEALLWLHQHSISLVHSLEQGWEEILNLKLSPYHIDVSPTKLQWQKWAYAEKQLKKEVLNRLAIKPKIAVDEPLAAKILSSWLAQELLQPAQAQAINQCCLTTLSLLSGGPGTGKTHTAAYILKALLLTKRSLEPLRCALVAPTGKAAATLTLRISLQLKEIDSSLYTLQGATLHALLPQKNVNEVLTGPRICLPFDLIIIDESSMIDLVMMAQLFASTAPTARIVLIGDHYQLPPVEPGAPFHDMMHELSAIAESYQKPVFLERCMRTDIKVILEAAYHVRSGNQSAFYSLLEQSSEQEALFWRYRHLHNSADRYISVMVEKLLKHSLDNLETQLCLLTPLRKGPWGSEVINDLIKEQMIRCWCPSQPFAAPIIITTNDYKLKLFNGESGMLYIKDPFKNVTEDDYALFAAQEAGAGSRRIAATLLPRYEWAWCLSVHKSQGSEFKDVIVLLPAGSEHFGPQLLYTAMTRARCTLEIWGSVGYSGQL